MNDHDKAVRELEQAEEERKEEASAKTPSLKELKEDKIWVEQVIVELVTEFANKYNVSVSDIRLWGDVMGSLAPSQCTIDIKL